MERIQTSSKTKTVEILHKDGTTSFEVNGYIIDPDPRVKLVYLYFDGVMIGAIQLTSIGNAKGSRWGT